MGPSGGEQPEGQLSGSTTTTRLIVRSPADLIAAIPYLLGFHPAHSLVVVALRDRRIVFVARGDLAEADTPERAGHAARYFTEVLHRQDAEAVVVIGYGPANAVTPVVDAVRAELYAADQTVLDLLRVTDGRYWSYLCTDPGCCPVDGRPYDPTTSQIAAAATYAGQVALPDRATLVQQLAPVTGAARTAMRRATDRARRRLATLLASALPADPHGQRAIEAAGRPAVRAAMRRYGDGATLTDAEVAWLTVLLTQLPVRDHTWERIGSEPWQPALWLDVLRRAEPDLAAAPASLLAFSAWRLGQGALAAVAVERALQAQPDYSMALLMDDVLRNAVPPERLGQWPFPAPAPADSSGGDHPSGGQPVTGQVPRPVSGPPGSSHPVSGPPGSPRPVSGPPGSSRPVSGPPGSSRPVSGPPGGSGAARQRRPRRRRPPSER